MKNGRRNLIIAVLVLVGVAVWLNWPSKPVSQKPLSSISQGQGDSPAPAPSAGAKVAAPALTPTQAEIEKQKEEKINALYLTPIAVYGKVVDESGKPVSEATVEIGINDKPAQTGSDYVQTTDTGGLFSLTGVRGIAFNLRASKEGYYTTAESRGQRNVIVPANDDVPQPTEGQPIVLVLRKKGETVPLIFVSSRQINVPSTGQPMNIDLATGRSGQGGLQVESWLGDSKQARFDWRYQLSVPGGGLIERKGKFDFEAPADGYQSTAEINMPASAQGWSSDVTKSYFAKLPDGRYARFSINFYPGNRNFVVIESYVNPAPGSRGLEFDPKQKIKAQ